MRTLHIEVRPLWKSAGFILCRLQVFKEAIARICKANVYCSSHSDALCVFTKSVAFGRMVTVAALCKHCTVYKERNVSIGCSKNTEKTTALVTWEQMGVWQGSWVCDCVKTRNIRCLWIPDQKPVTVSLDRNRKIIMYKLAFCIFQCSNEVKQCIRFS